MHERLEYRTWGLAGMSVAGRGGGEGGHFYTPWSGLTTWPQRAEIFCSRWINRICTLSSSASGGPRRRTESHSLHGRWTGSAGGVGGTRELVGCFASLLVFPATPPLEEYG